MSRRVLITGATSGIGLALAARNAARGDRQLLTGRRNEGDIRDLIPAEAAYARIDQTDPRAAADAVPAAVKRLGWDGIDLAILNAGSGLAADPADETAQAIRQTLDVNAVAPMLLAHSLHPLLRAAGGRLVLVGSVARRGASGFAAYAASKSALHGFGRALAEEWRGDVAVRVIHPGPTASGMHAKAGYDPGRAGRLFLPTATMAAMIERAAAGSKPTATASYARYLFGGYFLGRR